MAKGQHVSRKGAVLITRSRANQRAQQLEQSRPKASTAHAARAMRRQSNSRWIRYQFRLSHQWIQRQQFNRQSKQRHKGQIRSSKHKGSNNRIQQSKQGSRSSKSKEQINQGMALSRSQGAEQKAAPERAWRPRYSMEHRKHRAIQQSIKPDQSRQTPRSEQDGRAKSRQAAGSRQAYQER